MMFGRAEGLVVDWEGSQLLIIITASADDSCTAHMLDVGRTTIIVPLCAAQVSADILPLSIQTV
jgi:hypothetical protein